MADYLKTLLLLLFLPLYFIAHGNADSTQSDNFVKAIPVWSEGRETEKNLTLSFREIVNVGKAPKRAVIRLTASCDYRLRVNGEFVAHGHVLRRTTSIGLIFTTLNLI